MRYTRDTLDRAKPCSHTFGSAGSWITWYDATGTPTDDEHGVTRRCLYCGETFSLGVANDRVPALEMRLADALSRVTVDDLRDSLVGYHVECDAYDRAIRQQRDRRRK